MVEADCRAEDDPADQQPRIGVEPLIQQPTERTERNDRGEERETRRVRESGLSILLLIRLFGHDYQLSRVR